MITPRHPPSNVVLTKNWHLTYLCEQMRPDERDQFVAFSFAEGYDPEMAAKQLIGLSGVKFTGLGKDGMPIYAGGFFELRPGVWESWMVGSMEGWATHWRHMTKTARWLMQSLLDTGARRLQTSVLASRVKTCEWYVRSLGMVHEGTQRQFGRNGEDVACFSRVKGD